MNPKVAKMAATVAFDAADYTWVDLTDENKRPSTDELLAAKTQELQEFPVAKMPMLFEKMAVLPRDMYGELAATLERVDETLHVAMWIPNHHEPIVNAKIKDDPDFPGKFLISLVLEVQVLQDLMRKFGKEGARARIQENVSHIVTDIYIATISTSSAIETYTCPRNPANAKRRRKKKLPLYEWKTIVIDPSEVKRVRDAAAPYKHRDKCREHEVRGHWAVRRKTGKRYWVRAHKRGDPSKGTVFHDYQLAGETK